MTQTPAADIVERLWAQAAQVSQISREVAEAKSLRQADNPDGRRDLYAYPTPAQTLEGKAATEIEALQRKLDEAGRLPPKATRAWAVTMANIRQGRGSTPRCEPPSESDIQWAFDRIKEVLEAARHLPLASIRGETD